MTDLNVSQWQGLKKLKRKNIGEAKANDKNAKNGVVRFFAVYGINIRDQITLKCPISLMQVFVCCTVLNYFMPIFIKILKLKVWPELPRKFWYRRFFLFEFSRSSGS